MYFNVNLKLLTKLKVKLLVSELRSIRMLICLHVTLYIRVLLILQILPHFWIQVFTKLCCLLLLVHVPRLRF